MIGIEDEVMLLDSDSLELAAVAAEVLARLGEDPRFKLELPASQLEIVTPPTPHVPDAALALLEARHALVERSRGLVRVGAAGVHPFSPGAGELNRQPRYEHTIREYASIANRQLVCALQVHVSVGDAGRALAVYNAARSYLPWLAALAANAPFYEGHDTGLASVRPKLSELLPRQGVPPAIASWEAYADTLRWGAATGAFLEARTWWWELRPHPRFGTLEFRVPDGQATVGDAAAIAAVTQALVAWLGERHDAGESLPVGPSWRIAENRWSACRHGVEGTMAGLHSGTVRSTRACLEELLETLEPVAERLGAGSAIERAGAMIAVNGAIAQRRVAAEGGLRGVIEWLAERFLEPYSG
jgi:glutamate---cysteine ligase / carboxylate-amine ligase